MGGKRAQKEEVFSIINLSLQSFVLCSGKQLWQQHSFDPTKYYVPGRIIYHPPLNVRAEMDFKITHFNWTKAVQMCSLFGRGFLERH